MPDIEHLVILVMENHSFDEYFGTYQGVAGFSDDSPYFAQPWSSQPGGVQYPWRASSFTAQGSGNPGFNPPTNAAGQQQAYIQSLTHVWSSFHQALGFTVQSSGGASPTYSVASANINVFAAQGGGQFEDPYAPGAPVSVPGAAPRIGAMSYYAADDIPYHWALAKNFALCDNYHHSVLSGTAPNRVFLQHGTIVVGPPDGQDATGDGVTSGWVDYAGTAPPLLNNNNDNAPPYEGLPNYIETLYNASDPDNPLYHVYDDFNWWFPDVPADTPTTTSLNPANYFPSGTLDGQPISYGGVGDPYCFQTDPSVNDNGDPRPLFAQHVNPLPGDTAVPVPLAPVTWLFPPGNASEHPENNDDTKAATGARYISQIVEALINSEKYWKNSVLMVVYDETNAHFDHVVPNFPTSDDEVWVNVDEPASNNPPGTPDGGFQKGPYPIGPGLRVPAIIVSPWTYRYGVISTPMDHTSILQLVEDLTQQPSPLANPGWRRSNFKDLGTVVADLGTPPTLASAITFLPEPGVAPTALSDLFGVPTAATAAAWQTCAQLRYANQPNELPLWPPNPTPPAVTQECELTLLLASYGLDQVRSQANGGTTATFHRSLMVTVAGFEAFELVTPNALYPVPPTTPPQPLPPPGYRVPVVGFYDQDGALVPTVTAACSGVSQDPTTVPTDPSATGFVQPGVPTYFTFTFDVTFSNLDFSGPAPPAPFDFPNDEVSSLQALATFSVDTTVGATAPLELVAGADPQFKKSFYQGIPYLSDQVLVVQYSPGAAVLGQTLGSDPNTFVTDVVKALNVSVQNNDGQADSFFAALQAQNDSESASWLSLAPTQNGQQVYNFGFARVQMEGQTPATGVRVFFRLFPVVTTNTAYSPYYASIPATNAHQELIAVPAVGMGSQADQYVSLPFFASGRAGYDKALAGQSDLPNVRELPPAGVLGGAGTVYEAYYGCWLDINQQNDAYIPIGGPPSNAALVDGPFTGLVSTTPQGWISGVHQCLLAEISFDPIEIPPNSEPASSPWLAQRNLAWVPTA